MIIAFYTREAFNGDWPKAVSAGPAKQFMLDKAAGAQRFEDSIR
jgi:hypothetical protein